jgi:hypothetical protein
LIFSLFGIKSKHHFRFYRTAIYHPFIVVVATEERKEKGNILLSGYMMTTSITRAMDKPTVNKRLKLNPNPNDDKVNFVNKHRINDIPAHRFTKSHSS